MWIPGFNKTVPKTGKNLTSKKRQTVAESQVSLLSLEKLGQPRTDSKKNSPARLLVPVGQVPFEFHSSKIKTHSSWMGGQVEVFCPVSCRSFWKRSLPKVDETLNATNNL